MNQKRDGLARSVQTRLARHARTIGTDPNLVITRYAIERLLYRLSCSPYADRFVLKGALLVLALLGDALRPTRDADLLGFGELPGATLTWMFAEICLQEVEPDGMIYAADSVRIDPIRAEDAYGGQRRAHRFEPWSRARYGPGGHWTWRCGSPTASMDRLSEPPGHAPSTVARLRL